MEDTVQCNNCGMALEGPPDQNPEERYPCPKCGSKLRKFTLFAGSGSFNLTGGVVNFIVSKSNLLLQTVVVPTSGADRGQLVEAVTLPWFEIIDNLKNDPALAYKISDQKWEEIVAGAYKKAGFDEVILTPRSGDYGRDVIAIKRGLGSVRVIDQVKAYKPDHLVTANDVRALMGVLQCDPASKGFLTTTSDFAPKIKDDPLIIPLVPSRLEFINGRMLLTRLEELGKKKDSEKRGLTTACSGLAAQRRIH